MKNIIILTLLLLVNTIAFAQEHNMGAAFNCKLKKGNFNTESYPCPACAANDKKEKDAKNAEIKRRNDMRNAYQSKMNPQPQTSVVEER